MSQPMKGMAELAAAFRRLDAGVESKAARRMVASGAAAVRAEAKIVALGAGLKLTGALIRNIAIKRERTPAGLVQYNIGVRHGRHLTAKIKRGAYTTVVTKSGRSVRRYENDPWYWAILHGGAKAHEIIAQRGKDLKINGRFTKVVQHPGIKAVPFIRIAFDRTLPKMDGIYALKMNEFLKSGG